MSKPHSPKDMQQDAVVLVCVADILIEFQAVGCRFSDTCFQGFGMPAITPSQRLAREETITVGVRPGKDIAPVGNEAARFSSPSARGHRWLLQHLRDGTEVVTTWFDDGDTRAAQIRFSGSQADLEVEQRTVSDSPKIDPFVFPLFNIFLSRILLGRGGFLIHSSVVCTGVRKGLLFTAPSGTGKSTIARLFGERCRSIVINDDMVAVRPPQPGRATPRAFSIPMRHYRQKPSSSAVNAVFLLHQSAENDARRIESPAATVASVMANVVQQPLDAASVSMLTQNIWQCIGHIPTYNLGFEQSGDVVDLLRGIMKENARAKRRRHSDT